MNKVIYNILLIGTLALTMVGCDKYLHMDGDDHQDSGIDTLDFKLINTTTLISCMSVNLNELKIDSFFVRDLPKLKDNFTKEICTDLIPAIDLRDSVLIGYTTRIGGSGLDNERIVTYDRSKNALRYSITGFTNDTSLLSVQLNWVMVPDYDYDSVTYQFKIIEK